MPRTLRAGLVQMTSGTGPEDNLVAAVDLIREAAGRGARFVATPEMTTLVERRSDRALAAARPEGKDPALPAFRALARDLSITLLIGSMPVLLPGDRLANRAFLIGPDGDLIARYDKIHLFDVELGGGETYRESAVYQGGGQAVLAAAAGARFGLSICYDLRFAHLYRQLAAAGAEILCVPAAFTRLTGSAHWHVLLRARAIETGCFVLAPAQTGRHQDGRETYGHSLVVDPWGEVLADAGSEVGVIVADLDLDRVATTRRRIPALDHDRPIVLHSGGVNSPETAA